ncbi:MAG: 30S ribosomal protein S13 [Candidatus Diapherotrites archaeon]|uniref:30S ribosomal protein S13 n=1 Tax=Candidatus Iainarchaeum sp. TaxID=3101447 RepID=A0A7J4ISB9_9ARCH|nr:MAG: small subunit ribosomal protein S13 [archaeon GW2011_AR10]MBS3059717.1 30S ribosomal protein S13 [Candidatus Diapherotrites archaeon]HIH08352.1 30S ribosomal protein S13 [Candidatus Diapherotrites archaeon]
MVEQKPEQEIRYIVRIAGKDLNGSLPIYRSLTGLKGVGHRMAKSIAIVFEKKTGLSFNKKLGELNEEQNKALEEIVLNPSGFGIPGWSLDRQRDHETGTNRHLIMAELDFAKRQDLQKLAEIKSYRGLRLGWGLTVRGQRTKSTHRGKGGVVGVTKKDAKAGKAAVAAAPPKPAEKEQKKK